MENDNKVLVRRMFEALDQGLDTGDFGFIDEFYAPDYVSRLYPHQHADGAREAGPDGMRAALAGARAAFGERRHAVAQQVAEGDLVVSRLEVTLRHTGDFMGIAPTGRQVRTGQVFFHRVRDGKVRESWSDGDLLGLLRQLGARISVPRAAPSGGA